MQLQIQDVNFDLAQSLHSGIVIGNILLAVRGKQNSYFAFWQWFRDNPWAEPA